MPRQPGGSHGPAPEVCGEDRSSRTSSPGAACADGEQTRRFLEALHRLLGQEQKLRQAEEHVRAVSSRNEALRAEVEEAEGQLARPVRHRLSTWGGSFMSDSREPSPGPWQGALSPGLPHGALTPTSPSLGSRAPSARGRRSRTTSSTRRSLSASCAISPAGELRGEIEALEAHNESLRQQIRDARDALLADPEADGAPHADEVAREVAREEAEAFRLELGRVSSARVQEQDAHRERVQELRDRTMEVEERTSRRREELAQGLHDLREEGLLLQEQLAAQQRGLRYRLMCLEEERQYLLLTLDDERARREEEAAGGGDAGRGPGRAAAAESVPGGPPPRGPEHVGAEDWPAPAAGSGVATGALNLNAGLPGAGSSLLDEIGLSPEASSGTSPLLIGSVVSAARLGRHWKTMAKSRQRSPRENRPSLAPFRQQGLLKFNSKGICQPRLGVIPEAAARADAEQSAGSGDG